MTVYITIQYLISKNLNHTEFHEEERTTFKSSQTSIFLDSSVDCQTIVNKIIYGLEAPLPMQNNRAQLSMFLSMFMQKSLPLSSRIYNT